MAVTSCDEVSQWSSANWTLTGKTYTRAWKVVVGGRTDGAAVAITAGALPTLGQVHPVASDCFCTHIGEPQSLEVDGMVWRISARYATPDAHTPEPDPLNDPVQIAWGHYQITEELYVDRLGTKILNSAGDPFDPPPQDDVFYPEVTIVRNVSVANWDPTEAKDFMNSVNSAWFRVAGVIITEARLARITEFTGNLSERNGVDYYAETIRIAFNLNDWDLDLLDQGLFQNTGGAHVRIWDDGDATTAPAPVVIPWRLDGTGARLATGGAAVDRTFQTLELQDFNDLSLPRYKDGT